MTSDLYRASIPAGIQTLHGRPADHRQQSGYGTGRLDPQASEYQVSQVRNYKFAQDSHFDTWWVEDGSFIRGQNFVLGYTLGNNAVKQLHLSRVRVYASVQNLFVITKYTGYDPEVDTFMSGYGNNSNFSQNLDFFSYPRPRTWNLGLNVTF